MDTFKDFLSQYLAISVADWEVIQSRLQHRVTAKNEVLTMLGEVENNIYFLESGAVRLYYEGEQRDVTLNIGFPNAFIGSHSSFLTRAKSEFVLQCLTPCKLTYISHEDLMTIYEKTDCGHELGRVFTEKIFLYLSKRENSFLLESPTKRYLSLFEEQPQLILEIPQKYLASYIGITPQALSRIRGKLLQGRS
ncbi:MAG: Crp/Fnr family transcriptional regulator [Bacteroidia bacterium]